MWSTENIWSEYDKYENITDKAGKIKFDCRHLLVIFLNNRVTWKSEELFEIVHELYSLTV